jgi:hypothetical protein
MQQPQLYTVTHSAGHLFAFTRTHQYFDQYAQLSITRASPTDRHEHLLNTPAVRYTYVSQTLTTEILHIYSTLLM